MDAKPYLRDIELKRDDIASFEEYPFCLPVVRELDFLTFHSDVTFSLVKTELENRHS